MPTYPLPNGRNSYLPILPRNGQIYTDSTGLRWRYNEASGWVSIGRAVSVANASDSESGYLSPQDKNALANVPLVGGGFGIIVDPKLSVASNDNKEGVITGDIKLVSESLDIKCVTADQEEYECANPIEVECLEGTKLPELCNGSGIPGLMFSLSEKFLNTFIINAPGPKGKRGDRGEKGDTGTHGFGQGPVGDTGQEGLSTDKVCVLTGVEFNDLDELTDEAIIDIQVKDNSSGCIMKITKAPLDTQIRPAAYVAPTPLLRTVEYSSTDQCESRMGTWSLVKPTGDETSLNLQLLKLSKTVGSDTQFTTMSLSDFVTAVVNVYNKKLNDMHLAWKAETKQQIESVDDKARTILSTLADELSRCEFNLPATEFCVTFSECPASPTPA